MNEQLSYFTGRDGFHWWIGVVEDRNDPETLGRVRVRVFGYHTDDKTKLPDRDLPWAFCIQPANSASSGGIGSSPTGPIEGTWVIGFWRDPDFFQEPMVLGTVPGIATSAPQGQTPYDYSSQQQLPPPSVETVTITGDGTTTEFSTPVPTEDTSVQVTIDGDVQQAENAPPSSPSNVEPGSDRNNYEGGTVWTEDDFSRSRYKSRLAANINSLVPEIRDRFGEGVKTFLANNPDYDCTISFGYRSLAQQRTLYNEYQRGGPKAAYPGNSWHNWGAAIDFVVVQGRSAVWDSSFYTGIAREAFSRHGLKNDISNDSGHFYPTAFPQGVPEEIKSGAKTVADYAREKGIAS